MEAQTLVNRVANSGLTTINLEDFYPEGEIVGLDLKSWLFMELILKEKDFRESLKNHDWSQYLGKNVGVFCSADAIIPMWAWMLVATQLAPVAQEVFQGTTDEFVRFAFTKKLATFDTAAFSGQRIVIKGCSDQPVPASAYLELTRLLQPEALSIMFGEPCSTVPVFKRKMG
jgi:hypothetical protein